MFPTHTLFSNSVVHFDDISPFTEIKVELSGNLSLLPCCTPFSNTHFQMSWNGGCPLVKNAIKQVTVAGSPCFREFTAILSNGSAWPPTTNPHDSLFLFHWGLTHVNFAINTNVCCPYKLYRLEEFAIRYLNKKKVRNYSKCQDSEAELQ